MKVLNSPLRISIGLLVVAASALAPVRALATPEAPDWAMEPCVQAVAEYEVTTTEVLDVITGKGGATLTLAGVNAGGVNVVYTCTYTIDTGEVEIEYQ